MIPKVIHYCWYGGTTLPPLATECLKSWRRVWPDYEIVRWDESNLPASEYVKKALRMKKYANASNLTRFYALLAGGIYLDVDVEAHRDFGALLQEGMFLGWQDKEYVNNAVMGAVRGHPFVTYCILEFQKKFDATERAMVSSPFFITDMLRVYYKSRLTPQKTETLGDVTLLSNDYLYPYPYKSVPSESDLTENTVCMHRWMESWK